MYHNVFIFYTGMHKLELRHIDNIAKILNLFTVK